MSWEDILKRKKLIDVGELNRQREGPDRVKRLIARQQKWGTKAAEYSKRFQEIPNKFAPYTDEEKRRAASIGGFSPTQDKQFKELLENEQRKLEEAWAERRRELETQRSSAHNKRLDNALAQIDKLIQASDSANKDFKIVMSKLKLAREQKHQNLADALDRQKFENVKNTLRQAGLNDLLAQVEAIENVIESGGIK